MPFGGRFIFDGWYDRFLPSSPIAMVYQNHDVMYWNRLCFLFHNEHP